ncbi:glycosyltransferase [Apilactobacillus bombintestini]|nr:glycosyltransferase [Apilactobacillus bombintestini]
MNKKILFIGMTTNHGGLETFMMNIFRKLNGDGYEFEFVKEFSEEKIAYEKEILKNDGVVRTVPVRDYDGEIIKKFFMMKKLTHDFFKQHHDYDAVHINGLSTNRVMFWVNEAQKYGLKVIVHSHMDRDVFETINGRLFTTFLKKSIYKTFAKINKLKLEKNNNIIKFAASKNAGIHFFGNSDFSVINNGINVDKFEFSYKKKKNAMSDLNISESCKIIMTVAKIDYQKNYPKIINVFNQIKALNSRVKLVIVGNGDEYPNILRLVKKYGLENDVIFLGIRNDVDVLLSAADLILMPSIVEAFPFALVESQAAGVPGLVSEGVVPLDENITGELTYYSLDEDDVSWAKVALNILDSDINEEKKLKMYKDVHDSKYNLNNSIREIKKIYDR